MPNFRRFLTRRWLLAFVGAAALFFGLLMLHPYPRQSLFGPTIRGKPWCVWEAEVRRHVHPAGRENMLLAKMMRWIGIKDEGMNDDDLFDHVEMLPLLLQMVSDPDPAIRTDIMWRIIHYDNLQHKSWVPVLRERLDDGDLRCRIAAARVLGRIEPNEPVDHVLLQILNDPNSEHRVGAVQVLMVLRPEDRFAKVVGFAKDANPDVRSEVLRRLHHFGRKALPILMQGLADPELSVRGDALSAIHQLCRVSRDVFPDIIPLAKHPDEGVRTAAMFMMQIFGVKSMPILIEALDDPAEDVRYQAVFQLENLGPAAKEATPALERRLADTSIGLRRITARAIETIDPERFQHLKVKGKIE
jgi:hypothetical protein